MRNLALVLLAPISIAACGSPPPSTTPVTAKQNVALPASLPPAPLVDPPGLVTVAPPRSSVCELAGTGDFDLAATADGPALFQIAKGPAQLVIGSQGETFVEATTPTFTLRGFVAHDPSGDKSLVYAAKWLSFGGVYFPGIHDAMSVAVHDGKISLTASDNLGFHFAGTSGTLDVTCDDIALTQDRNGVLRNSLPQAFEKHDGKLSVLKYTKSVSLSADPESPAVGTFDVREGPATVTVIERNGKKARVRSDHFIGWVDASALKPFTPRSRKDIDAIGGTAMLAALGGNTAIANLTSSDAPSKSKSSAATTLVCTDAVRILALAPASPNTPFAIGTIPAGKPVHLSSRGDDISMLVLDDDPKNPRVSLEPTNRFAVPNKDLASCPAASVEPASVVRNENDVEEAVAEINVGDAIDALPAETPKKTSSSKSSKAQPSGLLGVIGGRPPLGTTELGTNPLPQPTIQPESANASGTLALDVVTHRVGQGLAEFRQCYQRRLNVDPTIAGHTTLRFTIDARGSVTKVATSYSTVSDVEVRACIEKYVLRMKFPPTSGTTDVTYGIGLSVQ